jgi:hypothetical protein
MGRGFANEEADIKKDDLLKKMSKAVEGKCFNCLACHGFQSMDISYSLALVNLIYL